MLSRCAQQLHLLVEELTHAAEVEETPAAENCHILLFDGVNCGTHSIFVVHVPGLNCCTPCENGDYHCNLNATCMKHLSDLPTATISSGMDFHVQVPQSFLRCFQALLGRR